MVDLVLSGPDTINSDWLVITFNTDLTLFSYYYFNFWL